MNETQIKQYDCCIIGGGINGAGIARDLASRGKKVVLLEKGDFGSGTSSQSSKLAHGGLRYLTQGNFKLVYESCIERDRLIKNAPHLVQYMPFILPIYKSSKYSKWMIRIGMMIYDCLALFKNKARHKMMTKKDVLAKVPGLNQTQLIGGVRYYDAIMDDARLCLEAILQAKNDGADIYNYTEVISISRQDASYVVTIDDKITDKQSEIKASVMISATGVWSDQLIAKYQTGYKTKKIMPSKGIHIIVKQKISTHALILPEYKGDRVFFIIPRKIGSLIGTTDTAYSGDIDHISIRKEEIDYLLAQANHYLNGEIIQERDILSTYCGLRPLLNIGGVNSAKISRAHKIIEIAPRFLAVVGGKYTTFRKIGEAVARKVCRMLAPQVKFKSTTVQMPLWGGDDTVIHQETDPKWLTQIKCRYGSQYETVEVIINSQTENREWIPGTDYLVGEVIYAIRYEMAKKGWDFIRRRSKIYLNQQCSETTINSVLEVFSKELNWGGDRIKQEKKEILNILSTK